MLPREILTGPLTLVYLRVLAGILSLGCVGVFLSIWSPAVATLFGVMVVEFEILSGKNCAWNYE